MFMRVHASLYLLIYNVVCGTAEPPPYQTHSISSKRNTLHSYYERVKSNPPANSRNKALSTAKPQLLLF